VTERSNLAVFPNVMLVQESSSDEIRFLPGDLAVAVYRRSLMGNTQLIQRYLTPQQYIEYQQYLPCALCGCPCAGSCTTPRVVKG
jgi:hypothetical protein